jgi:hypothetical protein
MVILRAEISFNTVYAAAQHEHTEYMHDIGKAKYLEGPLLQYAPEMEAYLGARVKAAIETAPDGMSATGAMLRIRGAAEDALASFAEVIKGAAIDETPLEEGTLRGSAQVATGKTIGPRV